MRAFKRKKWNNFIAPWRNATFLETDPSMRGDNALYSQDRDMTVATADPYDPYASTSMVYVDPVIAANPSLAPYIAPTNTAELEAQAAAQRWAEDQARLAIVQAAQAEADRIAEANAARIAMAAQLAQYEAQNYAENMELQANAARINAIKVAADLQATQDQIAFAQAEAERITIEFKKAAERYAAEQIAAKAAADAAAASAKTYAATLKENANISTTMPMSDTSQIFIAGGVAAIGIVALLFI